MLVIVYDFELNCEVTHDCITDCIQTSITLSVINLVHAITLDCKLTFNAIYLLEVALDELDRSSYIYILILEYFVNLFRLKLFVTMVGNALNSVANIFFHLLRKVETVLCLKDKANATLTGLGVDADYISIICSSNVLWVQWKVRSCPHLIRILLAPLHTLSNGILVRT